MIIASGPYLSPHFCETVARNRWPVIDAGGASRCRMDSGMEFTDLARAAETIKSHPETRLLTSGEQALDWVSRHLEGTQADQAARLFKDKAGFRRMLRPLFPWLSFAEMSSEELQSFVPRPGDYPFVIKPAVGFFSIGVHTVRTPGDWDKARDQVLADVAAAKDVFPAHMLSRSRFLVESFIEGEEFAVDAYYDEEGQPVVLNVLEHRYAGPNDVSDRLYVSSRRIIEELEPPARQFLCAINRLAGIRNFPLHAEFRRDRDGVLVPIEINPLRFGGWCTTGDFAHFAWGFNSYELYMNSSSPDWEAAFRDKAESEFGLVVLDNRTGIPGQAIKSFDYDALLARFSRPLHLERMNWSALPLFGFLFVETAPPSKAEQKWILGSDLGEFVSAVNNGNA